MNIIKFNGKVEGDNTINRAPTILSVFCLKKFSIVMGNSNSKTEISYAQTELICTDRNLPRILFKIPKNNKLTTADFSGNQLDRLPKNLDHVTVLNISRNKISQFNIKM